MAAGRITVICGCMFSGKSERLVDLVRAARAEGRRVATFKHADDDRYAAGQIVTHTGRRIDATAVRDPRRLVELAGDADLVAIDEAQFFAALTKPACREPDGCDLVEACRALAEQGRDVIVAGLDLDSWGLPFGPVPELAAVADEVVRTHGRCARCGAVANHTQRVVPVEGHRMVGGPESYEPRCHHCFQPPPPDLRR